MFHAKESCRDAVFLLGSMNRGVKWDFWPVMLLRFTHIFAGLPFEHTNNSHNVSTARAFLSLECIALEITLSPLTLIHDWKFHRRISHADARRYLH